MLKRLFENDTLSRRRLILTLVCLALACIFDTIAPWGLVQAIDRGVETHSIEILCLWIAAVAIVQILASLGRFWSRCEIASMGLRIEQNRLKYLFHRCLYAEISPLTDLSQGQTMGQILFSATSEQRFFEAVFNQGIPLLITTVGSFAALLMLSVPLTCVCFLLCPCAAGLWLWMRRNIRPAIRDEYEKREDLYRRIIDVFRAITSIRALHQDERFEGEFNASAQASAASAHKLQKLIAIQGPFFDILQALSVVLIFGIGGYYAIEGTLSVGAIVGFQIYLARLFGLLRSGTGLFGAYQEYVEGRARSNVIEQLPQIDRVEFSTASSPDVLRIDHLNFAFHNNEIWHDFSFAIREGEKRCILAPSGSGKTTLARCILGLYPTPKGTISLPDGDSRSIGFVPQDAILFRGSLRDNIAMLCPDLSDDDFNHLLYICCLEPLAKQIGRDSIGEAGSRLSGGEQRRVMLARALANRPKLLIIDQMTSEIEPELCQTIFSRIVEDNPKIGILYLGHRQPEWDV